MASKAPPIPPEQRSYPADKADIAGADIGRRDKVTGAQSEQPGDDDVNIKLQGRHANIAQNTTRQGNIQNR
jgi:hypothetical protein